MNKLPTYRCTDKVIISLKRYAQYACIQYSGTVLFDKNKKLLHVYYPKRYSYCLHYEVWRYGKFIYIAHFLYEYNQMHFKTLSREHCQTANAGRNYVQCNAGVVACVAGAKKGREGEKNARGGELEGAPALKAQCFPSSPSDNSIRLTVNTGVRHAFRFAEFTP